VVLATGTLLTGYDFGISAIIGAIFPDRGICWGP
jgi:hypothetical protein